MEGAAEAVHELLLDDSGEEKSKHPKSESPKVDNNKRVTKEDAAEKMAAASKELTQEQKEKEAMDSSSVGSMVYSLVKKVALVGGIYLVGYMGWSVAWLIG